MGNPIPWDLREPGIPQQITGIPLVISQMSLCYRTSRGPFPSLQNMGRSRPSTRLGLVRFRDSRAVGMRPPLSWCHVLPDFVQSHCVCKRPEACTACLCLVAHAVASLSSSRTVRSTRVLCNAVVPCSFANVFRSIVLNYKFIRLLSGPGGSGDSPRPPGATRTPKPKENHVRYAKTQNFTKTQLCRHHRVRGIRVEWRGMAWDRSDFFVRTRGFRL